ncbi:lytic murein transglycosylase [Paraconexibacter algicola]|uniref:lytic murein transglycosylase n=1 Tax=Paraconexibacter algicola TaxID=2133960 RepID=UPI001304DBEC|nr:lytic murein transglycosylase [Paraconexibacter algicola]
MSDRSRITAGLAAAGLLGAAGLGAGVAPSLAQDAPTGPTGTPSAAPSPTATPDEGPAVVGAPDPTPTPRPEREDERPAVVGTPTAKDRERDRARRETAERREAAEQAAQDAAEQDERTQDETDEAADRAAEEQRLTGEGRNADGSPSTDNPTFTLALPGVAPEGVPNFLIEKFRIPPFLLPIYQAAGIEYGVRWEILAAINEIETDYGRNLNVSTAGALGWMQFMPATWKAYGVDANRDGAKDPYNPVDAIFAAARYLKAAGADEDIRKAIFAYNHADWYVESVLMRARLIGGLPADLVGSLTGLTQGLFPVAAKATYADDLSEREATQRVRRGRNAARLVESTAGRRGIDVFAKAGSPAVAVQDGEIVRIGRSARLGRFVQLRDVYGNTYTYAHLGRVAATHLVPREGEQDAARRTGLRARPLPLDPAPAAPASTAPRPKASVPAFRTRGASVAPAVPVAPARSELAENLRAARAAGVATTALPPTAADVPVATADAPAAPVRAEAAAGKERLFANPQRPAAYRAGGARQLAQSPADAAPATEVDPAVVGATGPQVAQGTKLVRVALKEGSRVLAGSTLGVLARPTPKVASHLRFEIRPAGRGAPRIDPKPILDGWKLLESTAVYRAKGENPLFGPDAKTPSIGQILLLGKEALQRRVLDNRRLDIYPCGRDDIRAGVVDRRVLATLEFLAASGLELGITSLRCGHGYYTSSGNVSEHTTGTAMDIATVNGIPVLGHQGEGSVTDLVIRRLLTLQGTMKPHQIISLMAFEGTDNTLALPDHADHIHVGFRPQVAGTGQLGQQIDAVLKPNQWTTLIERLGQLDNPSVATAPSDVSIPVAPVRAGDDG